MPRPGKKRLTVDIDAKDHEALKKMAQEQDRTITMLIKRLILQLLGK